MRCHGRKPSPWGGEARPENDPVGEEGPENDPVDRFHRRTGRQALAWERNKRYAEGIIKGKLPRFKSAAAACTSRGEARLGEQASGLFSLPNGPVGPGLPG